MSLPPDAWVPVRLRWRHVVAGDVFFSTKTGDLWTVVEDLHPIRQIPATVKVQRGWQTFTGNVDPDEVVQVLVPVTERDVLQLTRDELGARVVERRLEGAC